MTLLSFFTVVVSTLLKNGINFTANQVSSAAAVGSLLIAIICPQKFCRFFDLTTNTPNLNSVQRKLKKGKGSREKSKNQKKSDKIGKVGSDFLSDF